MADSRQTSRQNAESARTHYCVFGWKHEEDDCGCGCSFCKPDPEHLDGGTDAELTRLDGGQDAV